MSKLPGLFKIKASYKPTAEIETFVGEQGELFYDEEEKQLRISDGVTPGGIKITAGDSTTITDGVLTANIQAQDGIESTVEGDTVTIFLSDTEVAPGTYGNSNLRPVITVDSKGRITDVSEVPSGPSAVNVSVAEPITLTGNSASVNLDDYSLGILNDYVITNKTTGEIVDLPVTITDTEIIFSSNIDLSNFDIEISFLSDTDPASIDTFTYDLSGTEYSLDFSSLGNLSVISYYVLDSNGNIVDVPTFVTSTEFRLNSTVDLTDHTLYLVTHG